MKNNYQTSFFLKSIICLVFALWVTSSSKAQAQTPTPSNGILYVNKAVSGGNGSGDSWANAIPELADALKWTRTENEADNNWLQNDSLQVFVAKGTYLPLYNAADGQYTNNGNRDNAFVMVKNVQLYGGFDPANNITDLTHTRDFSETTGSILSGDFNNDDVVTGGGASLSFSNNTENAHHIVIATDDVGSALLDGFSLIGGNADGNISTNITVNGQIIWKADGGGIYNHSSSPSLSNLTITENTAAINGGGMCNEYSSPILTNITFVKNEANHGGGIHNFHYSSPSLTNIIITKNKALDNGGGIRNNNNSSPNLINVNVSNNTAINWGGGMNNTNSSPSLTNVSIVNNTANYGGGVYNRDSSSPSLTNVSITNNTATNSGGGMRNFSSSPSLTNVSIVNNTATNNGGGMFNSSSSPTINNTIVWGGITDDNSSHTAKHSLIQGKSDTTNGNINATSLNDTDIFTDPANGDYNLKNGSPAINTGSNSLYTNAGGDLNNDTDLAGNPRLFGNTIDIGAFERQNVPPTAICKNITVQLDANGQISITASDVDDGSSDLEGNVTLSIDKTDFDCSNIGDNTILLTVEDSSGATATCQAIVTVKDITAPAPDNLTLADITAECKVFESDVTIPTATDNCGETIYGTHNLTFPISTQGTHVITWTFDDGNGNADTQTQNIIINDVTAPTPDNLTLADITAECQVLATDVPVPTATDNCGETIYGTHNLTFPISTQGTHVITWTFDDGNGNADTQTQNIIINDVTAPTPDNLTLADITAECKVLATDVPVPTATDNCGATIQGTHNLTFPISTQGTHVITWTFDDGKGNADTQTQNIIIDDVTAPVSDNLTLADVTAECQVLATDVPIPTATDNCGETIYGTHNLTFPISTQGTHVITWTFDDGNGNADTQTQNIIIDDVTAPTPDNLTLADITAECQVLATDVPVPTATDNCGETIYGTHNLTFPINTQGTHVITWTFDDGNGNADTQTQNIIIDDVTAPTPDNLTLTDITAECQVLATDVPIPTATDNCGATIQGTHNLTFPISTQGTHVITWTFDDGNGNADTQTQNIIINDVTAPTPDNLTLADITAECQVLATDVPVPTATDNCGATIQGTHNLTFPISTQGTHVITWTFDDGNGNADTQTQNIIIDDITAPAPDNLTLTDITAECQVLATDVPIPTATDNCGETIYGTHNLTFPINTQGTHVITWTFDDGKGNADTQTQNIIIDDVTAPTPDNLTLADITAECQVLATDVPVPTATDNCGETIYGTHNLTFPISTQGMHIITWTFDDGNGNADTQTQNIIIDDVTAPTPDNLTLADITAECQVLAADVPIPTATDNCGATIQGTHNLTFPISTQGTHVITWTFDDGNGNADTQTQNIIIDDVTTPTPDNLTLADITAECQVLAADVPVPTATDNCGETIYGTHNLTFPISTQGTHVITWTFDDGKGNADTQTQSIIIDDVTTPTPDVTNLPVIERQCAVLATDIPIPTATDNCSGLITVTTTSSLNYSNPGTYSITWKYHDGNGNISTQTQSIIVHPSPIENVTLNDLTVTYDGNLHQINVNNLPTGASVSYSTTPNTGEANGAINAGVYTVTAIVSPPANAINCEDISLTATLTIEKAPQEITFNSLPILYIEDDDDFQLAATASSGLPVDYTYTFTANNPPATVSSTGWVTLLTSGMIEITAHQAGNENYLPATPVMQPLQINSRDANIHRLFVGNDTYVNPPEEIYYLIDCETEQEYVNILIETEINAEVTPAHSFDIAVPKPGIYKQKVKVTSQDGEHQKSYTIIIEKRFSFEDIVVQKFNNVLLVNNNPSTNGGYSFIDYWWYKNGEMIAQNQYYSAGSTAYDLLNPQDEYWVKMLTTTGEVLQTCIGQINLKNYNGSIYPNPTQAASYITVQVGFPDKELKDIHIDLYNLNGALVKRYKSSQRITELKLPEELAIGTYLLVCTTAHYKETFRLIVE